MLVKLSALIRLVSLIAFYLLLLMRPLGAAPLTNGNFEGSPFLTGWTASGVITQAGLNGSAQAARLTFNTTASLSQTVDALANFTFDTYVMIAGNATAQTFRILLDSSVGNAIEVRGALGNIIQVNNLGTYTSATSLATGATFPIATNSPVRIRIIGRNFGTSTAEYDLVWSEPGSTTLSHAAVGLKMFVNTAAATGASINNVRFVRTDTASHSHWYDDVSFVSGGQAPPTADHRIGTVPIPPVALPLNVTFDTTAAPFTPSPAAEWSVVGGTYRNTIAGTANTSIASFLTDQLGGPPTTAPGFLLSSKFTVISNANTANTVGFGLFGTNANFTGGVSQPFYQIDIRPGTGGVRVLRVGINTTQFLPDTVLSGFTLNPALPFTFEVRGAYENGVLLMTVTTRQGTNEASFFVSDSEPLQVGWFGYRNRTNGGALTVDCDDFTLRRVSTINFTATPVPFARAGLAYSSNVVASSNVGASVTLVASTLPAWLSYAPGNLSGTPSLAEVGVHNVTFSATDAEGGSVEQTFQVTVLEPTGVIISEFLAENDSGLRDEDDDQPDWIELFNASETTADVSGWWLSDDPSLPQKWAIPAGTSIAPKAFLIVFASEKNRVTTPLHTSFKLTNNAGGAVTLANTAGIVVSSYLNYPEQRADHSYGVYGNYTPRGYLLNPTPGAPNDSIGYTGFVADPIFSIRRGFYSSPQTVTINCATSGATLIYTTNGSIPSLTNGTQATAPLALNITTTTVLRVSAFAPELAPNGPDTQSYFFPADIGSQGVPAGWPTGRVNGQVLDYGMDPDITSTVTAQALNDSLTAIPTLSIVTDLADLLDPATGIYVNPYGREDYYECPVSVELVNPSATPGFHINAGLRIRGGASREGTVPKHNFHLYFRGKYGAAKLNYPLFDDEGADSFDRIDLRTAQVMGWGKDGSTAATYTRDEWNRATHGAMGQPYTRSRYYHLYLNGVYWGVYGSQERADASFAASYFGGNATDYDVIKTYVIPHRVEAADGDAIAWTQLFNAATVGFASDTAYFAAQGRDAAGQLTGGPQLLDVDNLIDYNLLRFYAGDDDAPINTGVGVPKNFYVIRPRDGRFGFQFLTHDSESCMRSTDPTVNVSGANAVGNTLSYFNPRWLSQQLLTSARYKLRFADRAQRHLFNGGALDTPVAIARWREIAAQVSGAMLAESARWGDAKSGTPRTVADWSAAVNAVETSFITPRRATLITQLRARGLYPSLDAPAFSATAGIVPADTVVTITAPAATIVKFTLDGSDPMEATGQDYVNPVPLIGTLITLKARAKLISTGEWSALTEAAFTIGAIPATLGNLAISEIHYNPPGQLDATEFIELVNRSTSRLDLTGVHLTGAVVFTFGNVVLEPGARILVVEDATAFLTAYGASPIVAGVWTGGLNNTADTIVVLDRNDEEIERVSYQEAEPWPTSADGSGYSLVRINSSIPSNVASSWRPSTALGGNPGAVDSAIPFTGNALADEDHDGLTALVEHFLGTSDNQPSPSPITPTAGADGTLTITFVHRLATDDIKSVVEISSDLANWQPNAVRSQQTNNGDGSATEVWNAPQAGNAKLFIRIKLTQL
jgi:hypothetical protein